MKKTAEKSLEVLNYINNSGSEGCSLTEIQYFIYVVLNNKSEKSFFKKCKYTKLRKTRGYWCDALYGTNSYKGLLKNYCSKNLNNKWVLDRYPNENENMYHK